MLHIYQNLALRKHKENSFMIFPLIENIAHYLSKEPKYYQPIAASRVPQRACLGFYGSKL